jgi:hypothetical protein
MFVVDIPEVPTERAQLVLAQTGADDIRRNSQSSLRPTRAEHISEMIEELQPEINITLEDRKMFIMDAPDMPLQPMNVQ